MAIVVRGRTVCPLCGRVIGQNDDIEMFPPLVSDASDPLAVFSDAAVHRGCLEGDPRGACALALRDQITSTKMMRPICEICGRAIEDPDDYFSFGVLTSRSDGPLHRFNRRTFHRRHLPEWKDFDEALSLIRERAKEFPSPGLENIIRQMERATENGGGHS